LLEEGWEWEPSRTRKTKKGKKNVGPFDVSASLMKMEKVYETLAKADAKAMQSDEVTSDDRAMLEYIVAARAPASAKAVADWVPIAQMCVVRPLADANRSEGVASDDVLKAIVSNYCRELSHSATLGAPVFKTVPRTAVEYSVESQASFNKHVYDIVIEGKNDDDKNDNVMTKLEARKVLNLEGEDASDKSAIKKSYRSLTFQLHPDRFVGQERTDEEISESSNEFARVKLAYEVMQSGIRSSDGKGMSWYESLGGRERTEFSGSIPLMSRDLAQTLLERRSVESAVVPLNPEIVQSFTARHQAAQVQV